MSFVSYAQNFEDVILRRALKDVDNGFYIDVGANDPVVDSVSKAFYDNGWRGINIEPVSEWYEKLLKDRPDDINLQVAVGANEGEIDFYEIIGTGLSTTIKLTAERHVNEHGFHVKNYKVPVNTLSAICKEHSSPIIHFLKIDIEGAEKSALEGLDLREIRPWVILVESTLPTLEIEHYEEWEFMILTADYEFAYFDGLNRFYVAKEHQKISERLAIPPNVFDDFVLSGFSNSAFHRQIKQIQTSLEVASKSQQLSKAKQKSSENQRRQLRNRTENLKAQVQTLQEKETLRDDMLHQREKTISWLNGELKAAKHSIEELHQSNHKWLLESESLNSELKVAKHSIEELHQSNHKWLLESESLNSELKVAKHSIEELHQSNHKWFLESESLSSEMKAAKHTVEELHQSNHKWFLESERLEKQLQDVYSSYSWRITWSLRKLLQLFLWLFSLSTRLLSWITYPLKLLVRWLLLKANFFVLKRPRNQVRVQAWLDQHPIFTARLQRLKQADESFDQLQSTTPDPPKPELLTTDDEISILVSELSNLTPSAHRIYDELLANISEHQKGVH